MDSQERAQKNYHQNKVAYTPPPRNNPKQPVFVFFWCQKFSSKNLVEPLSSPGHVSGASIRCKRGKRVGMTMPHLELMEPPPRIRTNAFEKPSGCRLSISFTKKKGTMMNFNVQYIPHPLFRKQPPLYLKKWLGGRYLFVNISRSANKQPFHFAPSRGEKNIWKNQRFSLLLPPQQVQDLLISHDFSLI